MTKKPLTIEQVSSLVAKKGFILLSDEYAGNKTRLKIGCDKSHVWETTWKELQKGQKCPQCDGSKCPKKYDAKFRAKQLEVVRRMALEHGGECLSDTYGTNRDLLEFRCDKDHRWKTTYKNIVTKGSWCPHCLEDSYLKIEDLKVIAIRRGGLCLSDNRVPKKLRWRCRFGHEWEASVANVVGRGSWCPTCSSGLHEEVCRLCFETLLGLPFIKSRPKWLKNRLGNQLELDGYCESLRLAFEHQGEQHFKDVPIFNQDPERRQRNDEDKARLCAENGIALVCVPPLASSLKLTEVVRFIAEALIGLGFAPVVSADTIDIDDIVLGARKPEAERRLKRVKDKASLKGGECLGQTGAKYLLKCGECGHEWNSKALGGNWCPNCAVTARRNTLEDAKALAVSKGGLCLSTEYVNNHTKMLWQCAVGHTWESTYNSIQYCWCPICNRPPKPTLAEAQLLASGRDGKCLSEEYVNSRTRMLWQCAQGHRWLANYNNIKNNHWCPVCSGRMKVGLP
jgi:hypothetical protein